MILVQGYETENFNCFFVKRAGDNTWVPENTRPQDVHLDSVDFEGTWVIAILIVKQIGACKWQPDARTISVQHVG